MRMWFLVHTFSNNRAASLSDFTGGQPLVDKLRSADIFGGSRAYASSCAVSGCLTYSKFTIL